MEVDVAQTLPAGPPGPPPPLPARLMRIGRFTILDRLGEGAMGVVYSAYDETLDRKVAVKVLRSDSGGAQLRLVREAQAMARVSHPGVVTVLEAGVANQQVYVAMEFIRGVTLADWLAAAPRSWTQVLEVFTQAGRGLAAAHAAGLVHRDFKPSNVMIDDSGRVRVLDFGLVCAVAGRAPAELSATASSTNLDLQLTRDDDILGTPAYMAPEQWRGQAALPASDQYSFCVALYEALYGQSPYPHEGVEQLMQAVLHTQPREPPRRLGTPTWLAAVVSRGLRHDPKDRHSSMPALLAALDVRRRRGWFGGVAAGALAVCAAVGGFALARRDAALPACTSAPEEVARVWGAGQRDAVAAALRAAAPDYAALLWPRVAAELDHYADAWREAHGEACRKHHRGERSGALLDRQMRCLERRLGALDGAVQALASASTEVAARALEVVGELPALAPCSDLTALAAERPPPDDPQVARAVEALRARMTRAELLARTGQLPEAIDLATEIVGEAGQVADLPVQAEALLLRGRLGLNLPDETGERADWLTRAIVAGFAGHADAVAAEALALRIFAMARLPALAERALADEALALALAERGPRPAALRGLVFNNIGTVHLARQAPEQARRYLREALAVREAALGPEHREVGYTLMNLAVATDPGPAREELLARALAVLERELGPAHPEMIEVRLSAAHLVDPAAARALLRPGCAALERFLADEVVRRARCLLHLGRLAVEIGDDADADASFLAAGALVPGEAARGARLTDFEAAALAGYLGAAIREPAGAIARLKTAIARLPDVWWARADAAELRLLLGRNLLAAGRAAEGQAALEAALADHVALAASDPQFAPALARVRVSLAEALGPDDRAAARALLADAAGFYRDAGPAFARQLARSERLAAELASEAR